MANWVTEALIVQAVFIMGLAHKQWMEMSSYVKAYRLGHWLGMRSHGMWYDTNSADRDWKQKKCCMFMVFHRTQWILVRRHERWHYISQAMTAQWNETLGRVHISTIQYVPNFWLTKINICQRSAKFSHFIHVYTASQPFRNWGCTGKPTGSKMIKLNRATLSSTLYLRVKPTSFS